jgi:hypothetical protein
MKRVKLTVVVGLCEIGGGPEELDDTLSCSCTSVADGSLIRKVESELGLIERGFAVRRAEVIEAPQEVANDCSRASGSRINESHVRRSAMRDCAVQVHAHLLSRNDGLNVADRLILEDLFSIVSHIENHIDETFLTMPRHKVGTQFWP